MFSSDIRDIFKTKCFLSLGFSSLVKKVRIFQATRLENTSQRCYSNLPGHLCRSSLWRVLAAKVPECQRTEACPVLKIPSPPAACREGKRPQISQPTSNAVFSYRSSGLMVLPHPLLHLINAIVIAAAAVLKHWGLNPGPCTG